MFKIGSLFYPNWESDKFWKIFFVSKNLSYFVCQFSKKGTKKYRKLLIKTMLFSLELKKASNYFLQIDSRFFHNNLKLFIFSTTKEKPFGFNELYTLKYLK